MFIYTNIERIEVFQLGFNHLVQTFVVIGSGPAHGNLGPVSQSLLKIKVTLSSRVSLNFSLLKKISVSQSLPVSQRWHSQWKKNLPLLKEDLSKGGFMKLAPGIHCVCVLI